VEIIMLASSRKIMAAAVVAGLSIAATAAIAQQAAAPAQDGKDGKHEHHHMMPSQMVEARLAYIKTALQITPAQSTQWNAFADVVRKQAKARDAKITEMRAKWEQHKDGDAKPDLMARMEMRQKMLTEASTKVGEYITALKPLYASFSDSQKEIAPQVLGHHGHGGGWQHQGGR
jgi:predicted secreted Zn-dependent protease